MPACKTMLPIAIVVDSGASIAPHSINTTPIITVPQTVTVHSNPYPDWNSPNEEFYESLKAQPEAYKTSATNPDAYLEAFQQAAGWANYVLCIVPSPKLSASYDSAQIAKKRFVEIFGQTTKIKIINSQSGGPGISILALYLSRIISRGHSMERIDLNLMKVIKHLRFLAIVPSLSHLKASGRVPWIVDLASRTIKAKFIIELSDDRTKLLAVTKHMPTGLHRLLKEAHSSMIDGLHPDIPVAVVNANNLDATAHLVSELRSHYDQLDVVELNASAAVATHVGPGFIGIAFADFTKHK